MSITRAWVIVFRNITSQQDRRLTMLRHSLIARRRCSRHVPSSPLPYRPFLDVLEDCLLLATLTVTNVNDAGPGSLRQAILDSNVSVGLWDTINFNIGPDTQTISPTIRLPTIAGRRLWPRASSSRFWILESMPYC